MSAQNFPYYVHKFTHLKRDNKNGGAPHKPILLLSLIDLCQRQIFDTNKIFLVPEFVAAFKSNWSKLVITNHHPLFALQFYHMDSEPFWTLIPNLGCEKWIESKGSMRSLNNLMTAVNHVQIDCDLFNLLNDPISREVLRNSLLDKYFPETGKTYAVANEDFLPNSSMLNEPSVEYRRKIDQLRQHVDENAFQEEVFIRSGVFKKEIPKIYNNTCAISGMRIDAVTSVSMVDACHIVPFSESYDDSISNGIALSPNLHRAFDRGLISITDDYTVIVKKNFIENTNSSFNLSQFENQKILLPMQESLFPSLDNIKQHRNKFNF